MESMIMVLLQQYRIQFVLVQVNKIHQDQILSWRQSFSWINFN